MKQYNRCVMDPDGKWTRSGVLCMAGALFTLAVYYFGLRGLISVGFLEAVFCLFLPLIVMGAGDVELQRGKLCDLTPTMLDLMNLPKPEEMTGESLIVK